MKMLGDFEATLFKTSVLYFYENLIFTGPSAPFNDSIIGGRRPLRPSIIGAAHL